MADGLLGPAGSSSEGAIDDQPTLHGPYLVVRAQIDPVLTDARSVTMVRGPAEGVNDILIVHEITDAKKLPDVIRDEDEF